MYWNRTFEAPTRGECVSACVPYFRNANRPLIRSKRSRNAAKLQQAGRRSTLSGSFSRRVSSPSPIPPLRAESDPPFSHCRWGNSHFEQNLRLLIEKKRRFSDAVSEGDSEKIVRKRERVLSLPCGTQSHGRLTWQISSQT